MEQYCLSKMLVVEDNKRFVDGLKQALKNLSVKLDWAKTPQEALTLLKENQPYAAAIIDQHLPGIKGDELAVAIRKQYPELQMIFATGDLTSGTLTNLLCSGLSAGFIPKGCEESLLLNPIKNVIHKYNQELRILRGEPVSMLEGERKLLATGIVGRSEPMLGLLERLETYRRLQASTLILGESGSGKEVIAHAFAKSINSEILPVNCSTFRERENMMETELFGSVKGAYTDAEDTQGLFEVARGRVIFLDEIHHLSLSAQAKLLRVIQEKKFVKVGETSSKARSCDFKLICAGKPEIYDMMKAGTFLPDLFYRISTYIVKLPRLSERREDIEPLIEYFAKEMRYTKKIQKHFRASTIRLMESYSWPGEVRELRSFVESLFGTSKSEVIEPKDFAKELERKLDVVPPIDHEAIGHEAYMKTIETKYFIKLLQNSETQLDAGKKAGLGKSTFSYRLKILGINADEYLK